MNRWLPEHIWKPIPVHILFIFLGGIALALTGATPEEWVKRGINKLPRSIIPSLSIDELALAVRLFLALLGILFIVLALVLLLLRSKRSRVVTSAPIPALQGNTCPSTKESVPATSGTPPPPAEPPLPANAKFRYRDKVFWAVPRRYTKEEAEDMRRTLREVFDCIHTKSAPLVASYDGPAVMFTREWISTIQQQGPQSAIAKLDGIRSQVRAAHTELQEIVNRRPYYRQDVMAIIDDRGDTGNLNGALNHYIEALKSLPEKSTVDLIKLAIGTVQDNLTKAIDGYAKRISAFNAKMMLIKEELETLME